MINYLQLKNLNCLQSNYLYHYFPSNSRQNYFSKNNYAFISELYKNHLPILRDYIDHLNLFLLRLLSTNTMLLCSFVGIMAVNPFKKDLFHYKNHFIIGKLRYANKKSIDKLILRF